MSDDARHQLTPLDYAHDARGHGCFAIDLDGQVECFVPSVRDALIEQGLLYQDADTVWHLRLRGLDLREHQKIYLAVCDFCSARPVCWNIPCETFEMPGVSVDQTHAPECRSVGDWAACDTCGTLVVEGRRRQLLERALVQHAHGREEPHRLTRASRLAQADLHAAFWKHYAGGAVRIAPHPFGH